MPGLADFFNAPTGIEFEGKTYQLRQPTLLECLEYQRRLEADARANAARAVDLDDRERRQLLRDVNADITAGVYAWGQEVCVLSLRRVPGIARLMSIICADQGLTEDAAHRLCDLKLRECVAAMGGELYDDGQKKNLLATLGLPPNFLSTSSSGSPTPPTGSPPPSSADCPSARSTPSS